jgi:glycosyltransferase involved in cell wall biosynthesis
VVVGRLIPEKRIDRFLRALALARAQAPQLRGAIVGDGPERLSLETLARGSGLLPEGVRFLGARSDVTRLLKGADVLVLSSDSEGFPNVLLEAMAARTPVVTTPAGDAARVVVDGETGWVVPFEDEGAMAARLIEAARDPSRARRFGEAGRRRAAERYATSHLAASLREIYERCGLS